MYSLTHSPRVRKDVGFTVHPRPARADARVLGRFLGRSRQCATTDRPERRDGDGSRDERRRRRIGVDGGTRETGGVGQGAWDGRATTRIVVVVVVIRRHSSSSIHSSSRQTCLKCAPSERLIDRVNERTNERTRSVGDNRCGRRRSSVT